MPVVRSKAPSVLRAGAIVVTESRGSHESAAIRTAIGTAGASLLYRPPYSPDLDPIEQAFSTGAPCSG